MSPPCGRSLLGIALATTAMLGCQFDVQGLDIPDGAGVDVTQVLDAEVDADLDGGGGCTNGVQRCHGLDVEDCEDGEWTFNKTCFWGCAYNEEDRVYCASPLWAENVNMANDVGTGAWVADQGLTVINTDDWTITTPSGPLAVDFKVREHLRSVDIGPVTIIGFAEIQIPDGARVEVEGTQALALVASGSIVIAGELMAQGRSDGTPGPGGYPGGLEGGAGGGSGGGAPGAKSSTALLKSGAGGGGHTGLGGDGGTVVPIAGSPVAGGPGGTIVTVDTVDGSLVGGHGGGSTAGDVLEQNKAPGGGGGGALMLAAQVALEVLATGVVNVGGGGSSRGAGAGGGSGGMVLIQTHICLIEGVVAANGGGGGDVESGESGEAGSSGDLPTPGGGAHGGDGGAGSDLAGVGGTANDFNGGGGGGSAGFIRIDTVMPPDIDLGTISPHELTAGHAQNAFPTY